MTTALFHRWIRVHFCALAALFLIALLPPSRAAATESEWRLLEASGVPADRVPHYLAAIDALAADCRASMRTDAAISERIRAVHEFLHERVLHGKYVASASDVGQALDGGPFNCVAATLLLRMIGERCGVDAAIMSTRGHVWFRAVERGKNGKVSTIDVESTCHNWFEIATKYRHTPTERVSPAMRAHRERVITGRALADRQILAVLHFNRGVTLIRENRLAAAAWSNLQAVSLDTDCQPARENLAAVAKQLRFDQDVSLGTQSRLILWAIQATVERNSPSTSPLAAR